MRWSIGIDVGGTVLKAAAVAGDGAVRARASYPMSGTGAIDERVGRAAATMREFERQHGAPASAVGVCAPGLASADGRCIAHLPNKLAGIEGLDWTRALRRGKPVPVLNDAQAALRGEAWIGAARQREHAVLITLGTGVGGAVLSGGRLLRGAMGRAGHLGHMSLDMDGARSIVGMPGAVEIMVGDCTVRERTGGRFGSTVDLIAAHLAGDASASRVWFHSVRALAVAIGSCINLFDPEIIVVGGGVAKAGDALFDPLRAELKSLEWRPGGHAVPVVPAELGEWAGAIGAAREALLQEEAQAAPAPS